MKAQLRKYNKLRRRDKPLHLLKPLPNPNPKRRARRDRGLRLQLRSQLARLPSKKKIIRRWKSTRSSKLINMKSISNRNSIIRSQNQLSSSRNTLLFIKSTQHLSNRSRSQSCNKKIVRLPMKVENKITKREARKKKVKSKMRMKRIYKKRTVMMMKTLKREKEKNEIIKRNYY
jgi:hypothetical protein